MTNELGHKLAKSVGDTMTLGAYRFGNRLPWVPGALIDVWVPCVRGEGVTGVAAPHVYFRQTLGERSADSGSIHCPTCRADLAVRRTAGSVAPLGLVVTASSPQSSPQSTLPF